MCWELLRKAREHPNPPEILLTTAQRFEFRNGLRDKSAAKIDTQVQFPLSLSMLPYTNRARDASDREAYELTRSLTYDLMSVVVHVGEIDTGHYISYCRVGEQVSLRLHPDHEWRATELTRVQWFTFNDHRVELASKSDVLGAKAYLLFYCVRALP
jgi:ubiquitin carboxyl-terminal hydrolase 22/27/51